jgi:hypothetical protein
MFVLVLTIGATSVVAAQQTQEEPAWVVVAKPTTLLGAPDGKNAIQKLSKGAEVAVLPLERSGDFVYAGLPNGTEGWIRIEDTKTARASGLSSRALFEARSAPAPCASSLATCPPKGCSSDPTHKIDSGSNEVKNVNNAELDSSSALDIDWNTIKELQEYVAETLRYPTGFGTSLTKQQRAKLRTFPTSHGPIGEGTVVSLIGFVSETINPTNPNPHAGGAESCNCDLTDDNEIDWHINLGPSQSSDEYEGIVIEITPHHRLAGWSLDRIAQAGEQHTKLKVTGQLFFDNVHKIRRSFEENKRGNPARFSLWEIHPIRSIEVVE